LLIVVCGAFGLAIGSFLNVVIYRVPRKESIVTPPSACPSCGTELAARDNIPVLSWVLLRGKCRTCGAPISWQYPVVELLTAGLFAGIRQAWAVAAVALVTSAATTGRPCDRPASRRGASNWWYVDLGADATTKIERIDEEGSDLVTKVARYVVESLKRRFPPQDGGPLRPATPAGP